MSEVRMSSVALVLLDVVSLVLIHVAEATESIEGSGTSTRVSSVLVWSKTTDDGTLRMVHNTWILQGTLAGTLETDVLVFVDPTGLAEFTETGTFTGTINGASGTLARTGEGTGMGGAFQIEFELFNGTGGLANVEGEGTSQVQIPPGVGSYSVTLQFEA